MSGETKLVGLLDPRATYFSCKVSLVATGWLVGDGHLKKLGLDERLQDLVPELSAIRAFSNSQKLSDAAGDEALAQDRDLVPT